MRLIYDASSLFNLANGGVLSVILSHPAAKAFVGPQVYEECKTIRALLDEVLASGLITKLSDEILSADVYFDLFERLDLGPGETECIAFVIQDNEIDCMCSDDACARRAASSLFGAHRVTGTIGRLAVAVSSGLLNESFAFCAYQKMVLKGGFLPKLTRRDFSNLVCNARL